MIATVASFAFGALWYSPLLSLKPWNREAVINPKANIANPARVYGLTFVLTLLTSFALAVLLGAQPQLGVSLARPEQAAGTAWWRRPRGINYQFANRSLLLWAIGSGFHIVRFLLMGVVLGLGH